MEDEVEDTPEDIPESAPEEAPENVKEYEKYVVYTHDDGSETFQCKGCGHEEPSKGKMAGHFNPRTKGRCTAIDWDAREAEKRLAAAEAGVPGGTTPPPDTDDGTGSPYRRQPQPMEVLKEILVTHPDVKDNHITEVMSWAKIQGGDIQPSQLFEILSSMKGLSADAVHLVTRKFEFALHKAWEEYNERPEGYYGDPYGGPGRPAGPGGYRQQPPGYPQQSYPPQRGHQPHLQNPYDPWQQGPYPPPYADPYGFERQERPRGRPQKDPQTEALRAEIAETNKGLRILAETIHEKEKVKQEESRDAALVAIAEALNKLSEDRAQPQGESSEVSALRDMLQQQTKQFEQLQQQMKEDKITNALAENRQDVEKLLGTTERNLENLRGQLTQLQSSPGGGTELSDTATVTLASVKETAETTRTTITAMERTLDKALQLWTKREAAKLPEGETEAPEQYTEEQYQDMDGQLREP